MPLSVMVSTEDFDSLSRGSNPLEVTDRNNYIFYCLFVVIMNNLLNL